MVQANSLSTLDKTRPKQANLRRAVSSAYYARFHALVAAAVETMIPARSELRATVARKFQHKLMKEAAQRAAKGELDKQKANSPVDPDLLQLTNAFVDRQEARHKADYDLNEPFAKLQASRWIQNAGLALAALTRVRLSESGERLFWEMLLGKLER